MFSALLLIAATPLFATWDASLFERREAALAHYGVPAEPDFQNELRPWSGRQSRVQFEAMMALLDGENSFSRYATWDDRHLMVFQDADTKAVPDFTVTFAPSDSMPRTVSHTGYIAENYNEAAPLAGLRVALDPGHFGNEIDDHVGKVVRGRGRRLREGTITGQTCWLVMKHLMELGVRREDILLTRPGFEPVTAVSYDDFPLETYARRDLLNAADESWFHRLLTRAVSLSDMLDDFAASGEITGLFLDRDRSPARWASMRTHLFARVAELEDRATLLNSFRPDLTIIIHYDTVGGGLQHRANHVKAFVPGHWMGDELGSRSERYTLARHALDTPSFLRSVRLSRHIVQGISTATDVPIHGARGLSAAYDRGGAVAAGVYTRNLALNRLVTETEAIAYVEALFYDNRAEFMRLSDESVTTTVDGYTFSHSERVDDVARGVVTGVLEYLRTIPELEAGI